MEDQLLVQRVQRVLAVLEKAEVPKDIRAAAFDCVWNAVFADAVPVRNAGSKSSNGAILKTDLRSLAAKLGVEVELAAEVFDQQEDGSLTVQLPTSKLASTKLDATRELALLVCAARQCAQEEWTGGDVIRAVCQDYGKFDSANNASIMAGGDMYWMMSGTGRSRKYKLRKRGWEEAGNLVRRLVSGS